MNVLYEAVLVGIVVVVCGLFVNFLLKNTMKIEMSKGNLLMLNLFITGSFTHLFFEYLGLNKWYCKHGFACQ
jgi:hypothetical protein